MKVTRIKKGHYKIEDNQGTWIARGGYDGTDNGKWVANDCENIHDCNDENSWAVSFDTFAQLKKFASSFNN